MTQVLIYVGGILVILLFGVMLTNNVISVEIRTGTVQTIPALIIVAIVAGTLAGLSYATWKGVGAPAAAGPQTTTGTLGQMLMTSYVIPFEIASVVLLVALIGAAMTARRHRNS